MTLFKLGIAYTEISRDLLLLHTRAAILEMLRVYAGEYAPGDVKCLSPYQSRKHRETLAELHHAGLIVLERDIPAKGDIPQDKLIAVPTNAPWPDLSFAEMKTYIALFALSRHSRNPWFRFVGLHERLAEVARLSRKAVGIAVTSLVSKGLLQQWVVREEGQRWASGTAIQLLDPGSGASLNDVAWTLLNKLNTLPIITKYKLALKDVAPEIEELTGYTEGFKIFCPFCKKPEKKTLRIKITHLDDRDTDEWFCSNCSRHGDATKLCSIRSFWVRRSLVPLVPRESSTMQATRYFEGKEEKLSHVSQ